MSLSAEVGCWLEIQCAVFPFFFFFSENSVCKFSFLFRNSRFKYNSNFNSNSTFCACTGISHELLLITNFWIKVLLKVQLRTLVSRGEEIKKKMCVRSYQQLLPRTKISKTDVSFHLKPKQQGGKEIVVKHEQNF